MPGFIEELRQRNVCALAWPASFQDEVVPLMGIRSLTSSLEYVFGGVKQAIHMVLPAKF